MPPDANRQTNNIGVIQYQLPDASALVRADEALAQARTIVIDSHSMMEMALEERAILQKQIDKLDEERMIITRPIDAGKKAVMDFFKRLTGPRTEAVVVIDTAVRKWRHQEAQRLELEQADAQAAARAERERLVAQAEKAKAAGNIEQAAALVQTAEMVMAAPVATQPKVAGTVFSKQWVGEVTDTKAFLLYLADHPDRQSCIDYRQGELNALARSVKKAVPIPGFTATEREGIASRG